MIHIIQLSFQLQKIKITGVKNQIVKHLIEWIIKNPLTNLNAQKREKGKMYLAKMY